MESKIVRPRGHSIQGMHYWDTYSPVVSWSTVRLMLILGIIMGWRMRSLDFVLAFPQAEIKTDIFMKIPRHCSIHKNNWKDNILKLKKNLYGLCDTGRTWNQHITQGLLNRGFKQSEVDPCLFIKDDLVLYMDDTVVILPNKLWIDNLIKILQQDFDLTDDGDIKDYLGVRIERLSGRRFKLTQDHIINRCLEIIGIPVGNDTHTKTHRTPAVPDSILQKDSDGEPHEQNGSIELQSECLITWEQWRGPKFLMLYTKQVDLVTAPRNHMKRQLKEFVIT